MAWRWRARVAYVADDDAGLQIIDVSNPASPVRLGGYDTSGYAWGVAVAGNRIYVADYEKGLKVFCTLPNVQYMMRVEGGTLGTPYTIEAATNLTEPVEWTPHLDHQPGGAAVRVHGLRRAHRGVSAEVLPRAAAVS